MTCTPYAIESVQTSHTEAQILWPWLHLTGYIVVQISQLVSVKLCEEVFFVYR